VPDDANHLQLHIRRCRGRFLITATCLLLPEHQQGLLERHLRPRELVVPHREGVPGGFGGRGGGGAEAAHVEAADVAGEGGLRLHHALQLHHGPLRARRLAASAPHPDLHCRSFLPLLGADGMRWGGRRGGRKTRSDCALPAAAPNCLLLSRRFPPSHLIWFASILLEPGIILLKMINYLTFFYICYIVGQMEMSVSASTKIFLLQGYQPVRRNIDLASSRSFKFP
jgi:hypothetical protein